MSISDGPRRTYINFKKVDRARYAEACEEYIAEAGETRAVEQAEKTFRKAVEPLRIHPGAFSKSNQQCRDPPYR